MEKIWDQLEYHDLVKIELESDDGWSWEDLEGDIFNVELNESTVPGGARTILAQQKAFRASIERDGVVRISGYYRLSEDDEWIYGGGCGGYEYEHARTDEPQSDVKYECLVELLKALKSRCPCCRKAG